ncbi:MAG: hypothetical protein ACP5SH_22700 [Syntrophobacteraceae bacterium]
MKTITCGNIRFLEHEINELDGSQVLVSIPKSVILSITVCHGQSVEKPFRQVILGILMVLMGFVMGVWPLVSNVFSMGGPKGGSKLLIFGFAVPLIPIGIYTVAPVFRASSYLLICTTSGTRKLPIKSCMPSELINAGKIFGYNIVGKMEPE